ncbi:MAG: DUF1003 domain-containing protein [Gemmatimonadetes bacterium]|nr:DUF1003 domain-containing protein [Gemmatimonadota bacterium]
MSTPESLAKRFLRKEWISLTDRQRRVVDALHERATVSRDTNREFHEERTFGQRLADGVAAFGGSWTFILIFFTMMIVWATMNTVLLAPGRVFDPYPFVFLNLILSMLAALQAPVIMMSQNRTAMLDRRNAEADYEVNLKAEIEIRHLHEKLDELREARWVELVSQQERQIAMLAELLSARGGIVPPESSAQ